MSKNNGTNIFVCGSQNFTDRSFVYDMLNMLKNNVEIGSITSGNFSGASQYCKEWSMENKVKYNDFVFYDEISYNFYDGTILPDAVIKNDKFFLKGKDEMMQRNISLILPFPNDKGELGPATTNIISMAKLANIPTLDAAEAYQKIRDNVEIIKNEINKNDDVSNDISSNDISLGNKRKKVSNGF